ncbi:hypothetical protein BD560DRAFT_386030 [Blakeslea trispora]|nr:hypothetical protein BD560DRAFT_386030 [Blakeslea trispora]
MSLNSRYRERKYNTSENDRLLRALSQPVQAWDKTWTPLSTAKTLQTYKWTKSDRVIQFEPDEESEEEPEPMELEQTTQSEPTTQTEPTNKVDKEVNSEKTLSFSNENSVPGGPSTLSNKPLVALQKEEEEEEQRSQTPKLSDISDDEQNKQNLEEEEDNDVDSINDASKHPALAPHAQARLTDDDFTDSTAATPQTEDTPMAEDVPSHTSHPLSQEIHQGHSAEQ